jgi:hypothetical protein
MSISEHFRYRNDVFQSDIFVSDIGVTDVDVLCWISPTLRSISMPTYEYTVAKPRAVTRMISTCSQFRKFRYYRRNIPVIKVRGIPIYLDESSGNRPVSP